MAEAAEAILDRIALYTHMRVSVRRANGTFESQALRRPEVIIRRNRYLGVTVDEGVLTRAYTMTPRPQRMHAFLLLGGRLLYGGERPLASRTVLLTHPHHQRLLRFESAEFLELEWDTEDMVEAPTPLGIDTDPSAASAIFDGDPRAQQRQHFRVFFETFRRAGVTVPALDIDRMEDCTTERDIRLAEALRQQMHGLRETDAIALGTHMGLSPRQLQRVFAAFCLKYGFSLWSWRDARNRWRLMLAAVLLSRPELTIPMIAEEVGFRSTPALGRAFVQAGFPPPAEVRRLLLLPRDC